MIPIRTASSWMRPYGAGSGPSMIRSISPIQ